MNATQLPGLTDQPKKAMSSLPSVKSACLPPPRTSLAAAAVIAKSTCHPAQGSPISDRSDIRRHSRTFAMAFAALGLVLLVGCEALPSGKPAGQAEKPSNRPPNRSSSNLPVTLAAGDILKLWFPGAMEFNNSQKIRSDGKISLPLVGEVQAAGKTIEQLNASLTALYKPQLTNSEVVATLESGGARVVVSGAVHRPGTIAFERSTTVLQAILESGGFTELANLKKVHLIRESSGEHRTEILDLRAAMSGQTAKAIELKAGDMIYVPQKIW